MYRGALVNRCKGVKNAERGGVYQGWELAYGAWRLVRHLREAQDTPDQQRPFSLASTDTLIRRMDCACFVPTRLD